MALGFAMTEFCIQIQPERCRQLDLAALRAACEALARDAVLVRRFAIVEGEDRGTYVNLMFETDMPATLWSLLDARLYGCRKLGAPLKAGSMAMCQGADGWNDYQLLYHFDPSVPVCNHPPGRAPSTTH